MSLFSYSDKNYTIDDLCTLSSNIGKLLSSDPDETITEYEMMVGPYVQDYKTPDLYLRYICAVNRLGQGEECLIDELKRIFDCLSVLKQMIDSYTNHVLDRGLKMQLRGIKDHFDDIEKIARATCNAAALEEDRLEREIAIARYKLSREENDRDHVHRIVKFTQNRMQEDYDVGIRYIKRRQFLRREIYNNLIMNPNITGRTICDNINAVIASADKDFLRSITPYRECPENTNKFVPNDIYAEWNAVRSEIANGTFGQNYPDDVPDDYDEAKKYLKSYLVNVIDTEDLKSKVKDDFEYDDVSDYEMSDFDIDDDANSLTEADFVNS